MGRPKAELRVGDVPILAYLLDRWRWDGPTLLVTSPGRERPPGAERFTREVADARAGEGPLRGVITALQATETEALLVTTCDMPLIRADQLTWLCDQLTRRDDASVVMVTRGEQLEPFPLAVHKSALPRLTSHFSSGGRSLHSIASLKGTVVVPAPRDWPEEVWTNLNTPADLASFLERNAR
jgi:molybdopterin-guanine dinucleotide biosynthesis protein A